MRREAHLLRALLAMHLAAASTVARADEPSATQIEAARRLYQEALGDEKRGDFRQALEKLQRASTVKTTAASRYHMGLCEEKLGHLVAALGFYQAAEQQAQAEGKKEVVELVREPLARLSERVPRLTLRVRRPEPQGFELLLDGKPLAPGLFDLEIRVDVGPHPIEARAPGYSSLAVTHDAREGSAQVIEVHLERQAQSAALPAVAPVAPAASANAPPAPQDAGAPGRDRSASPKGPSAASIVSFGGAVLLGGFGAVSIVRAGALHEDGQAACAVRTGSCDDLKSPVRTWDALALGSFIGAGALIVTGVVLYTPRGDRKLSLGPGTVRFEGRF